MFPSPAEAYTLDNHGFLLRDFRRYDWFGIKALLNCVDFFQLFHSSQPASVIMKEFYCIVNTSIELYVPLKCHQLHKKLRPFTYLYRIRRLYCTERSLLGEFIALLKQFKHCSVIEGWHPKANPRFTLSYSPTKSNL
jgi:hypothetical protein